MKINSTISVTAKLAITFLILLISGSVVGRDMQSQGNISTMEAYAKWRAKLKEANGGNVPLHYAMSAASQRLDGRSARIDFTIIDQSQAYTIEIKPMYYWRDGNLERVQAGETMSMQFQPSKSSRENLSEPVAILPVDSNANAVEIKWVIDQPGKSISTTFIIPLETERQVSVYGMYRQPLIKRAGISLKGKMSAGFTASAPQEVEPECVTIQVTCSGGCGPISKKCKDGINNIVDCVNCTITCGTDC